MQRASHPHPRGAIRSVHGARGRAGAWGRLALVVCTLLATHGLSRSAIASGGSASHEAASLEYRIKSAYLFNFTKFVEWPAAAFAETNTPFTVGILATQAADPAVATVEETLRGKKSGARTIEVRVFARPGPGMAACHVIFVTHAARHELATLREAIGHRPVLLVGESESFAQRGGTINLAVTGDTVRCEINLRQAERSGLKLSGRLASVARLVREENPP